MIFRLYPLTAVGIFPGELQTDQIFIRVRHLGRNITDKNIFEGAVFHTMLHQIRGQHLVQPFRFIDGQRCRFHFILSLYLLVVVLRIFPANSLAPVYFGLDSRDPKVRGKFLDAYCIEG